ncbi:uncharacterized protein LOC109830226 isoform X2 [Asparagus officinalis]|uniref:uncharacterized protein LOC109830226 isoform X2 n=1 Tax=Asparagus officinalis TaxID=4686 RepID=UPI00098DF4A4|nr:uncharacterized protein LOC109830226 isoform X2 [Asparagus officinalis]
MIFCAEKESTKRRKEEDTNPRKSKDKRERVTDPLAKASSHLGRRPPYLPMLPLVNDDEISYKDIDPPMRKLLENNDQIFKKVHVNLSNLQVQENIQLLCQARDNLNSVMIKVYATPEMAMQMPPFPAKINIELTNSILPSRINTNLK